MTKNYYIYFLFIHFVFLSCNEDTNVIQIKEEAGFLINTSSSAGSFLGSPAPDAIIEEATVTITEVNLNYIANLSSGTLDNIEKIELVKLFSRDTLSKEIIVDTKSRLPLKSNLEGIDTLSTGFENYTLRIGDVFTFKLKMHQNDGDIYYNDTSEDFKLTLNCFADLEGSYIMTNSLPESECSSLPQTVNITENTDGTWHVDTADGGLLEFCSENDDLPNPGSFAVQCGVVFPLEENGVDYCLDYGIGCITGGSWNQETGTLILENSNTFFNWAPGSYTSTYIRQ